MEQIASSPARVPPLFNGSVETGIRAVAILEACYPKTLDLETISLFDYFVVHTADAGGPPSLHPAIVSRYGEYHVRRRLIQDGLRLMRRAGLIDVVEADDGLRFASADAAPAFLKLMATGYNLDLLERAEWLASTWDKRGYPFIDDLRDSIQRWSLEFLDEGAPSNG